MKTLLREISLLALQLDRSVFTDEQKSSGWLGAVPVSNEEIKSAETRLDIEFPDDYKNFLLNTNGFFTPCDSTEPSFETIEKVDYLKNIDPFLLEVWSEGALVEVGEQLKRAIVIAGMDDEQYFLIIPSELSDNTWQYWKFANWIPGEERYENLESYLQSVFDFMKNLSLK
jgi:hypothetical protein